jgi:hypothetical protein
MNYLDIDKNGLVDKDEFLRQLNKGEQTYKQSLVINKSMQDNRSNPNQRAAKPQVQQDNFFEEATTGAGTQSMFGFAENLFGGGKKAEAKTQDKPPAR